MPNESSKSTPRVFLIDAMSHIFRAFFAPMGNRTDTLRNSHGMPTQAVFVFTNILRKLLDEKPDYIAAVFESEEQTFRQQSFADYKANRAAMPDDLTTQVPYIIRVCEVFNIPILQSSGYEADDVIGGLAIKAAEKGLQAVIVSNDKDMCQLVHDPNIVCMRHNSQIVKRKVPVPPIEWCDEAWVRNKFGVEPKQIIELLGLMGDAVDNIPGAPGIGEKGAVSIIQQFGTVENAIAHADEVKHKTYRESLKNNADIIRQSVQLATIDTNAPVELDLEQLKFKTPNRAAAYQLFRELEFQALTREFADAATANDVFAAVNVKQNYKTIKTRAELDSLVRKLWETDYFGLAVDGATPAGAGEQFNSYNEREPHFLAIATGAGVSYLIDLENFEDGKEAALAPLADTLSNGFLQKFVHDLKRTTAVLGKIGIEPEGITEDTLLAGYLLDPTRSKYELLNLVREAVGAEAALEIPEGWEEARFRLAEAADFTARLAPVLRNRIEESGLDLVYETMELPLAPLLCKIELNGLRVDVGVLKDLSTAFNVEIERLTARIYELANQEFKINSPKQVGEVLQSLNIGGGKKTATGQISTSKDVLTELAETYELPRLILEYREFEKLRATYTDALPLLVGADGRIHGQLNQTVTTTGRLSSSNPNLQNIPIRTELGQKIRAAFVPEEGNKLISADYSQLELRLLAHVTKDPVMVEAFRTGDDIHTRTAELVFGARDESDLRDKRRLAKIVNFAIAYAVEPYGLSARVGISMKEAKKVIDNYYATYTGVRRYMDEVPATAREQGYVSSFFGRRRPIPGINDRNHSVRTRAEREAINMPIQGLASDIMKLAMLKVDEALKRENVKARIIMQVHDELLLEAPEAEAERVAAIAKQAMEAAASLDVPLIVETGIGESWMDTK
ncbi:MAG TPA: DNA polymerase I [Pyrinomonadaceae bacterium]|nr:DNA polymerase I [Pyrinomonadaceae bacterium]